VNVLLAVARAVWAAVRAAVIVVCASLTVLWAWVNPPGFGAADRAAVVIVAIASATLLLAALPGKPRQRRDR
jgi:hypothetical protein